MLTPKWTKPSQCDSSNCVEASRYDDRVFVRASRYPYREAVFSVEEWREFLAAVRSGEFDA